MIRHFGVAAAMALLAVPAAAREVTLGFGTAVPLATTGELSSKKNVKGDLVPLVTTEDVTVDGVVIIPKGAVATGQIIDAQAKGALGMSGKLILRPLYLQVGARTVRLAGGAADRASVTAGAVVGMVLLTPAFTGRSAVIPAGTPVPAMVEKTLIVSVPGS